MVKRLLNALFTPPLKVGTISPTRSTTLHLPDHPETPIELIRTNRKKSVALRVGHNRVRVTAPRRLALYRIQQLLHKRSEWIGKQLKYQASLPLETPRQYITGEQLRYLGQHYCLDLGATTRRSHTIELGSNELRVALTSRQQAHAQRQEKIRAVLGGWYKQRAEAYLPKLIERIANELRVNYGAIQIRHFKSRWGSCRADGRLQFNWRIMMAPPEVIEYVVVHELCHRLHLNHSPAFWDAVAQQMPGYKQHRQWLKENGHRLAL